MIVTEGITQCVQLRAMIVTEGITLMCPKQLLLCAVTDAGIILFRLTPESRL